MDKLLTRKNIFIVLGVIIALEVIWAGWSLFKSSQVTETSPVANQSQVQQTAITLSSAKTEYKLGEQFVVDISIASVKQVDGVDIIIAYDPKVLSAQPATLGTIFSDYPQNTSDATLGKVSISGITSEPGGVVPNGQFGKLNFVAKAAGMTQVSLDFSPGKTSDSNVTESATGKDVLEKVENLEVNINP